MVLSISSCAYRQDGNIKLSNVLALIILHNSAFLVIIIIGLAKIQSEMMFSKLKICTYTSSEIQNHLPNTNIHAHNFFINSFMNCPLTWAVTENSVWVLIDEVWSHYYSVLSVSVYLYSHLQQLSLKGLSSCLPRSMSFIHSSKLCQGESYANKNQVWPVAIQFPRERLLNHLRLGSLLVEPPAMRL